jgi:peroxiredoxin Q/BCP
MWIVLFWMGCAPVAVPARESMEGTEETEDSEGADLTEATDTAMPLGELNGAEPAASLTVPTFSARNYDGSTRTQGALVGQPTVMWFFPASGTSGCTTEGCNYRDLKPEFDALGVQIVGVSFANPATNTEWVEQESFNFEVWTDDDKALSLYYGAVNGPSAGAPKRITKLLDEKGTLILEYVEAIQVGTHPAQVLADCQILFGAKGGD